MSQSFSSPGRAHAIAGALLFLIAPAVSAQTPSTLITGLGVVWRYNGDTVWMERDSTGSRSIYRGDTVERISYMHGRMRTGNVMVIRGDSAHYLSLMDSTGRIVPAPVGMRAMPASLALRDREALRSDLRMAPTDERMRATPMGQRDEPPVSPASPIYYNRGGGLVIVQHRDTARYIRAAAGRADTTVWLFVGDTAVTRLSPAPRTFGLAMALGIITEMRRTPQSARGSEGSAAANAVGRPAVTPRPTPPPRGPGRIVTPTGLVYRYHADTVTREKDSTVYRSVMRGDTLWNSVLVDGRKQYESTWLLVGDSARALAWVDANGVTPPNWQPRTTGLTGELGVRSGYASALTAAQRPASDRTAPPVSPPDPVTYCATPALTLVQHRDTVRYINRNGPRPDTTVYVFTGDTTVARVSPSPRAFGLTMHTTIIGEMRMVNVRQSLASRDAATPIPGRRADGCGGI